MPPEFPAAPSNQSITDAHALVSSIIRATPRSSVFSTTSVVRRHPFLKNFRECILDLAYEELCRTREQGKTVAVSEFVGQFESIQQSLYRVIEFEQFLNAHPSFIDDVPESSWPSNGDRLCDDFELLEQIGRGALSRVFVARQLSVGNRRVVVKVCVRGQREADLLGKLEHPGIARVHSIDTDPKSRLSVICMPYHTRATLHHLSEELHNSGHESALDRDLVVRCVQKINACDSGLLATEDDSHFTNLTDSTDTFTTLVLEWGASLADALNHAHSRGVLHCDVKPGNVLVQPGLSVSLLDFNLASQESESTSGLVGGTLPYMAPEQLENLIEESPAAGAAQSPAVDVYGLCATLWHFVAGEPPFGVAADVQHRKEAVRILLARQKAGVSKVQYDLVTKRLNAHAADVLMSGLHVDLQQRPSSAAALADSLRRGLPKRRKSRITRVLIAATLVLMASTVLLLMRTTRDGQIRRGRSLLSTNQAVDARHIFEGLYNTDHSDLTAVQGIVESYLAEQDYANALNVLRRESAAMEHPTCRFLTAYCESAMLPRFTHAEPQKYANSPRTAKELGIIDSCQRDWKQAISTWEELIDQEIHAEYSRLNLAWLKFEMTLADPDVAVILKSIPADAPIESLARLQRNVQLFQDSAGVSVPDREQVAQLDLDLQSDGLQSEFLLWSRCSCSIADYARDLQTEDRLRLVEYVMQRFEDEKGRMVQPTAASVIWFSRILRTGGYQLGFPPKTVSRLRSRSARFPTGTVSLSPSGMGAVLARPSFTAVDRPD